MLWAKTKKVRRQVRKGNLGEGKSQFARQSRDRELQDDDLIRLENDQQADYNQLNGRINNLSRNVQQSAEPVPWLNGETNG